MEINPDAKMLVDHDYHIHSQLSLCSGCPTQVPYAILQYGICNHMTSLCLTDHFWDETVPGASEWYMPQNYERISKFKELPQGRTRNPDACTDFHFGCETDLDRNCVLGISKERMKDMEFIIIPHTHLHMNGFTITEEDYNGTIERQRQLWIERFQAILDMDLPFEKVGIAHMTCELMSPKDWANHVEILDGISDATYKAIFEKTAKVGMGIELNFYVNAYTPEDLKKTLRPYFIAKECGNKFYLGSDSHSNYEFCNCISNFHQIIDILDLRESDRFRPFAR